MPRTFFSPTLGVITLEELAADLVAQVTANSQDRFSLIVGSDSQPKPASRSVTFVTAVIMHHIGKGGRYYVHREQQQHIYSLRQRMFTEAAYSLEIGSLLSEQLKGHGKDWHVEVHLDIGKNGATKPLVREIVAWITQSGYEAKIKPDSFGASKVADRFTKG